MAIDSCEYRELKIALQHFIVCDPAEGEDPREDVDVRESSINAIEPVDDSKVTWVKNKLITMVAHDRNFLDFRYTGQVQASASNLSEYLPHGIGFAICTNTNEHCYLGNWRNGVQKGHG